MEETSSYTLARSSAPLGEPVDASFVPWREAYGPKEDALRAALWAAKAELDSMDEGTYYRTRDSLFPLDASGPQGSNDFSNRAGHKLSQCMDHGNLWGYLKTLNSKNLFFVDVCGGPGAFTQALLTMAKRHGMKCRGAGMTLFDAHTRAPHGWYPELLRSKRFEATFGLDGTGDIFRTSNIHALASIVARAPVSLVVADGGFDVPFGVVNFQEVLSSRIVFSQWLAAVMVLKPKGCFVLKLFDVFSPFSQSLLYLSLHCFDTVRIVKPKHSRVVNSERYLVASGFIPLSPRWEEHLLNLHAKGFANDTVPLSLLPHSAVDATFTSSLRESVEAIARAQIGAIRKIVERAKTQPPPRFPARHVTAAMGAKPPVETPGDDEQQQSEDELP